MNEIRVKSDDVWIKQDYALPYLATNILAKTPDGVVVKIIGGQFMSEKYGRLSNFWTWREVLPNGTLGKETSGYGWFPVEEWWKLEEHDEANNV